MTRNRILVDTSVWIEYLGNNPDITGIIDTEMSSNNIFITGPIITELLQGVRTERELKQLSDHIDALSYLECGINDWKKAGQISFKLRKSGYSVPVSDIIIAVVAANNDACVYTLDRLFKQIPEVRFYI
ncbi:MAG: PIN domain-containing protein [Ruminiclostridium sp.]|nr:PIN domain-containing protein [Ruminiclostridium sp.]